MRFICFNALTLSISAFVGVKFEFAVCGWNISSCDASNEGFCLTAVCDEIGNGNNLELVLRSELH